MKQLRYAQDTKIRLILAPQNIVATATSSQYVDLKLAQHVTFVVPFGAMTSDSTDTCTVTLECSTASSSNSTEVAIGFNYRLSAAVASDDMGAMAAATPDGAAVTATDDNKVLIINLDPSAVANVGADYRYVRLTATPNAEMASCNIGMIAFIEPRYAGNAIPSST